MRPYRNELERGAVFQRDTPVPALDEDLLPATLRGGPGHRHDRSGAARIVEAALEQVHSTPGLDADQRMDKRLRRRDLGAAEGNALHEAAIRPPRERPAHLHDNVGRVAVVPDDPKWDVNNQIRVGPVVPVAEFCVGKRKSQKARQENDLRASSSRIEPL
jgi:hypothetical protein